MIICYDECRSWFGCDIGPRALAKLCQFWREVAAEIALYGVNRRGLALIAADSKLWAVLNIAGAKIRPAREELGRGDEDSGAFAGPGPWPDYDFDVAVESVEEVHEAFDRKAFKTVV